MKRLRMPVVACCLMAGLASASDKPAPVKPTSTVTVRTLIDQLGSDDFADREAATRSLEIIGPPAVEALKIAALSESPEIRDRAADLLIKIQRATESKTRLIAKRFALSYKDMPIGTALNDLKTRTGLIIQLDPNRVANPLRRITCETAELPIWEALEAFCVAAELREEFVMERDAPKTPTARRGGYAPPITIPNAENVPIVLIDGKPDRLPGDRSTAVRVLALPSSFCGHKVTLGTGEIDFCLDVTPAPGLFWQEAMGVKITRVIDSAGRFGGAGSEKAKPPTFDPNGPLVFVRPGVVMRIDGVINENPPETVPNPRILKVPLRISTQTATYLKRLEGVVFAEINVPNQQLIAVTDPKHNKNVVFSGPGDLRFTILDVKEAAAGGKGSIRAQLEYPSPWLVNLRRRGAAAANFGLPQPPQHPSQGKKLETFDANGKAFPISSTSITEINDDGFNTVQTMQLTFNHDAGLPAKIVVVGPKSVIVQVPFALENVPLP
jgi:hypothetical protein